MTEDDSLLWLVPYLAWLWPLAFLYWLLFTGEHVRRTDSPYTLPARNFHLKRLWALLAVRRLKASRLARLQRARRARRARRAHQDSEAVFVPTEYDRRLEEPRLLLAEGVVDSLCFHGADFDSSFLVVRITRMRHCLARLAIQLKLKDQIYQLPQLPDSLVSRTSSGWSAGGDWGGLRVELVEPLRCWRVAFNGVLREGRPRGADWDGQPGDQDVLRHVRFNFLWTACSPVYNCRHDWSAELVADAVAREPWKNERWMDIIKGHVGGYDQWGTLLGQVQVEGAAHREVHLRGLRQRRWGPNEAGRLHRRVTISGVLKNGAMFSVGGDCHPGQLSHATYGHVRTPDGHLHSITATSLSLPLLAEDRNAIPRHFVLSFSAGGERYASALHLPRTAGCTVMCERPWSWLMLLEPAECSLEWGQGGAQRGVQQGVGLAELCYNYEGACPLPPASPAPLLHLRDFQVTQGPLVLGLDERNCRSSALSGGKGASLAALTTLLKKSKHDFGELDERVRYRVPPGFCLTVTALERQLEKHPALREAVGQLVEAAGDDGDLLAARCEATVNLFSSTPVCEAVAEAVRVALRRLEDPADEAGAPCWAVRSSAVGEDSEGLSAAGQNATFLGCRAEADVLDGVRRCWASLFALQSVQYRRQHAQPVSAPMAVVVQRMVAADKAGVLFTCDPTTGDPRTMLITANYGLGESVVSAAVDPDVVVVRRDCRDGRDLAGSVRVAERRSGAKQHRVVLAADGGVRDEAAPSDAAFCLLDDEVLELCRVGAHLERVFGGPRDVEWAFADGQLHLLQARPVTALFNWTDFELLHELDGPCISDEDVVTTANAGEVLPGATSPLGQSIVVRSLNFATGFVAADDTRPYTYSLYTPTTHHHVTINALSLMLRNAAPKLDLATQAADLAVYGHPATTPRMHRASLERSNGSLDAWGKVALAAQSVAYAWGAAGTVSHARHLSAALDVQERAAHEPTAAGVLGLIDAALPDLVDAFVQHSKMSNVSSFSQVVAICVLAEGSDDLSTDHVTDVAAMLSCSGADVISAEIPVAVKAIVEAVRGSARWREFVALPPGDGMSWLRDHCPPGHALATAFLDKFGHRVVREFDPATVTWDEDPAMLVASLQTLVSSNVAEQDKPTATSLESVIERLKSPRRWATRFLLRRLLPWFQSCVANREFTKEAGIRVIHKLRLAFRRLGALLEREGRLPERGLASYLTYWELHRLLHAQPEHVPVLVAKARRRRRRWPEWDSLAFPEILHGLPKPLEISDSSDDSQEGRLVAHGTPVSEGSATGRACVVLSLHGDKGISQLQAGDVLITHSTDVGWSPYFPMLGGVVTELGGLISHGAVVAREYGLPCLVGVKCATRIFQTGDIVKINGTAGTLLKIME